MYHSNHQFINEVKVMLSRRLARRMALQVLFANEFLHEDVKSVAQRIAESLNEPLTPFTIELITKTTEHEAELNQLIRKHLRNWEFDRVAIFDRVLIRLALCEILFFPDIPVEVSINEALEISKDFCILKSRRFVNGILDSIYKELKADNKILKYQPSKGKFKQPKKQPEHKGNSS
ncbi:MAG: transcription antitermination factor NusB [Methanobacteriota archaeon]|nr:MAG: transcription antitermination factor NusB [Euryarchaeota archaeon]